jgi:hypothetical protein
MDESSGWLCDSDSCGKRIWLASEPTSVQLPIHHLSAPTTLLLPGHINSRRCGDISRHNSINASTDSNTNDHAYFDFNNGVSSGRDTQHATSWRVRLEQRKSQEARSSSAFAGPPAEEKGVLIWISSLDWDRPWEIAIPNPDHVFLLERGVYIFSRSG